MVQDYNNIEKTVLLIYTPTIQQYSQYLFLLIIPTLRRQGMIIILYNIMQAYI